MSIASATLSISVTPLRGARVVKSPSPTRPAAMASRASGSVEAAAQPPCECRGGADRDRPESGEQQPGPENATVDTLRTRGCAHSASGRIDADRCRHSQQRTVVADHTPVERAPEIGFECGGAPAAHPPAAAVVHAHRELAVTELQCRRGVRADPLGLDGASDAFRGALELVELVLDREAADGHAERNREHEHCYRRDSDYGEENAASHGSSR